MCGNGSRSSIGDIGSRDNANLLTIDSVSELTDGLEFGIIERIWAGIDIDIESIDGTLFTGIKRSGTVGGVTGGNVCMSES